MQGKHKAAFFDRDGTIIKDVHYLSSVDRVEILEQSLPILRRCQELGYKLFVVTNQSGIARGYFSESFVESTHAYLNTLLATHGITFEQWYYCPHHPFVAVHEQYKQNCNCRKPQPGMLLQAAHDHNLDLSQSLMFGNAQTDLEAGRAAGCASFDIITHYRVIRDRLSDEMDRLNEALDEA